MEDKLQGVESAETFKNLRLNFVRRGVLHAVQNISERDEVASTWGVRI